MVMMLFFSKYKSRWRNIYSNQANIIFQYYKGNVSYIQDYTVNLGLYSEIIEIYFNHRFKKKLFYYLFFFI